MIDPELRDSQPIATTRMLRQFAGLWLLLFGGLAAGQILKHGFHGRAIILTAVAVIMGPGLVWPKFASPLFCVAMAMAKPMGWMISHLLLAFLFYLVFTPMAMLFRISRRDALSRRRRPNQATLWSAKEQPMDLGSYLRQV